MTQPAPPLAPLLTFTLTAPIQGPFDVSQITQVEIRGIHMDLVAGNVRVFYGGVGDSRTFDVAIALSGAQQTNFQNAVKNAIAAQRNVTFAP